MDGDPGALINLEIMTQVFPLAVSDASIHDSGDQRGKFQTIFPPREGMSCPPLGGVIPSLLGLVFMYGAWIPLKENRGTGLNFVALIAGAILVFFGVLALLPWSAQF